MEETSLTITSSAFKGYNSFYLQKSDKSLSSINITREKCVLSGDAP
jgi:hypothetical protein